MDCYVLGGVLDHGHVGPCQLLRDFGTILVRVGFFDFLENLLQKLGLLVILLNFNLFLNFCNLLFDLLHFLFVGFLRAYHHFLAVLSHHMVIEGTVRVIPFEECKLRFI